ncbi:hypothetical protein QBC38DRAFT_504465 [Podospora fimiseda]|uniref:Uncharacterized protein n=1 Tax=Podospora fimiseda TaxID=252190 RepID=A0AAN7BFT2_9PEZI|nr:hypothetical protein QBC38DRAFT_504465 [Podospora fimiseda]
MPLGFPPGSISLARESLTPQVFPAIVRLFNLNDKFFECIGSTTNRKPFRLLEKGLNNINGRLFNIDQDRERVRPVSDTRMGDYIDEPIATGDNEEDFLSPLRAVVAIWQYLSEQESRWAAQNVNTLRNLLSIFQEFDTDYWEAAASWAREWVWDSIALARRSYQAAINSGQCPANAQRVFNELRLIEQVLQYILALPPY